MEKKIFTCLFLTIWLCILPFCRGYSRQIITEGSQYNKPYQPRYFEAPTPELQSASQYQQNFQRARNINVYQPPLESNTNRHDQQLSDLIAYDVLELSRKLASKLDPYGHSKSPVFSPVSIASALSLLLLGANRQTYNDLLRLLEFDQSNIFLSYPHKIHEEFGHLLEDVTNDEVNPNRVQPNWKLNRRGEEDYIRGRSEDPPSQDDHLVNIANAVFVQSGFSLRPDYKSAVQSVYKSEVTPLNFQNDGRGAQNYINEWVNRETHGKIKTIIPEPVSPETNVIVASALYFKALWEKEFLAGTTKADFYPDGFNGPTVKVNMMPNGGVFPFYDAREYQCQIIGLPYKKNLSTMYIILPYNSTRTRLREMQMYLTADKIENMISRMIRKSAVMAFPRLHIQNSLNLKTVLSELGAGSIFNPGTSDFSLMSDGLYTPATNFEKINTEEQLIFSRFGEVDSQQTVKMDLDNLNNTTHREKRGVTYKVESKQNSEPLRLKDFILNKRIVKVNPGKKRTPRQVIDPLVSIKNLDLLRRSQNLINPHIFVDEVVHKVDLVVNEKGTEGGAATVAYLRRSGPEVLFRVETPFLILIRHDTTKLPLFYGAVYEPTDF